MGIPRNKRDVYMRYEFFFPYLEMSWMRPCSNECHTTIRFRAIA